LAEVARYEFDTLIQEVKSAVEGLERQRTSAIQAIEAAQKADEDPAQPADEVNWLVMTLLDSMDCLNDMLEYVMRGVEQIEENQCLRGNDQPVSWPLWLEPVLVENCQKEV